MRRRSDRLTAALRCDCGHSKDVHAKDGHKPCRVETCPCEAFMKEPPKAETNATGAALGVVGEQEKPQ